MFFLLLDDLNDILVLPGCANIVNQHQANLVGSYDEATLTAHDYHRTSDLENASLTIPKRYSISSKKRNNSEFSLMQCHG